MLSKLRTKMTEERGDSIVLLIYVPLKKYNTQGLICTILAHNKEKRLCLTWPGRKGDSGETFCMQCAWQPGCRVKLLNKTKVALGALFMHVCGCKVCACICSHVSLHTHIPVCMNTQVCLWCISDAQLRRDEFQMTENTTTTVSWIIFLETVHIFCFESYSAIIINLSWMQNFIVWVHIFSLPSMVSEGARSCTAACHPRLEFLFFGFLSKSTKKDRQR